MEFSRGYHNKENDKNNREFSSPEPDAIDSIINCLISKFYNYSIANDNVIYDIIRTRKEFNNITNKFKDLFFRDWLIDDTLKSVIKDKERLYRIPGFCDKCGKNVNFTIIPDFGISAEGLLCQECKLNARLRYMFLQFNEIYKPGHRIYVAEAVTGFYYFLQTAISAHTPDYMKFLIGSEFDPERKHPEIRHEDNTNLSFTNNSFDIYISNDVLEHVFDYKRAFKEAYRILDRGGTFLFHVPFYFDKQITHIRAKLCNSKIDYLDTPIYHGNPLSESGALCINDFGWDILDDLKECGFRDVYIKIKRDIKRAYLTSLCIVFYAIK